MKKLLNKLTVRMAIASFLAAVMLLLSIGCGEDPVIDQSGEPDKLGSWRHINQEMPRADNWQKIVTDSEFRIGEKTSKFGNWWVFDVGFGTYPSIDGSTVVVPMVAEFARQHLDFTDNEANSFSRLSQTHAAYLNLINRAPNLMRGSVSRSENHYYFDETQPVDIIIVTEPSEDELYLAAQAGVVLIQKPVCYDAFVFITHKDNPLDSLTVQQVRDIYSGRITNWREVGGKDEPISAYQREENSGSQTAMLSLVMQGTPMLPPEMVEIVTGMGMLVDTVAEYRNDSASIGYTYKFYIDALYKNENIKILRIDDISPEDENLRTGAYPFSTCYYGVIRGGEEELTGGRFLDWMLSEEGQRCIVQAGYVPYVKY